MLFATVSASSFARAETQSWLSDPFSTDEKALSLVDRSLKPSSCPGMPDLEQPLSIKDVLYISMCNNPDVRAAYMGLLANASGYGGTLADYFLPMTAGVDLTEGVNYARGSEPSSSSGTAATVTTGSVTIFDFGRREATIKSAERSLAAASYGYNATLQRHITAVMFGYYRLLASQQRVEVVRESERYAEESYQAAQLRYDIGQVPIADVLQAKGSYSQAKLSTQSAENQLSRDQASLALLIRLKPDAPVKVREIDDSVLPTDPFDGNVQALMETATQKRYDLTAERANLESAEASLRALKKRGMPNLSAAATASAGSSDRVDFTDRGVSIGLTLSIPIFTGVSQGYSETAARRQLSAQREQLEQSKLNVEQDVWNAWHSYQTSKLAWETSWDFLASATRFKDVALGRYKEGLGTILDVLSAQSQYTSALQGQLDAHYDLLVARVDLIRSVGALNLGNAYPENTTTDRSKLWNYD